MLLQNASFAFFFLGYDHRNVIKAKNRVLIKHFLVVLGQDRFHQDVVGHLQLIHQFIELVILVAEVVHSKTIDLLLKHKLGGSMLSKYQLTYTDFNNWL